MASLRSLTPEFPGGQDGLERPRKRLRKGTRSCWECKRRKVRCMLAGPDDARCEGCRRRGTACISQDLPDTPGQPANPRSLIGVEDRLGRVEALVEHLVEYVVQDGVLNEVPGQPLRDRFRRSTSGTCASMAIPADLLPPPRSLMSVTVTTLVHDTPVATKYHELSQKLTEAWPSQHDLELLLNLPVGNLGLVLGKARCAPSSEPAIPRVMLQLPPPGSHPVLIAQKLLLLSIFLRGIRSDTTAAGILGSCCHDIMSRAVEAAGLVTGHDELAGSVEGIECIMMESMYYDSAGNVRGAWIAIRRAIAMAQIMGLHRGPNAPSRSLGLEHMWFRLVQADRYMSLLLNLPQGSSDNVFATPTALDNRTAIEKMRRLDLLAAGRILQLTPSERTNSTTTHNIDLLLQQASTLMPPRWWLLPSPPSDDPTPLLDQFTHFHLLLRLHLPYLLDSNPHRTSSKITTLTASRAMLTRFLALHHHPSLTVTTYCRGMTLFAFTASATLCIAHLAAAQSHLEGYGDLAFLAHERQGDWGLVDRVLACLKEEEAAEEAAEEEVVGRMTGVLRCLVGIMEEAGEGIGCCYRVSACLGESSPGDEVGGVEIGRVLIEEEGKGVRVCLPYLGAVEVRRRENGCEVGAGDQAGIGTPEMVEQSGGDDWALHGVDALAFEDAVRGLDEPDHAAALDPWEGWMSSEAL